MKRTHRLRRKRGGGIREIPGRIMSGISRIKDTVKSWKLMEKAKRLYHATRGHLQRAASYVKRTARKFRYPKKSESRESPFRMPSFPVILVSTDTNENVLLHDRNATVHVLHHDERSNTLAQKLTSSNGKLLEDIYEDPRNLKTFMEQLSVHAGHHNYIILPQDMLNIVVMDINLGIFEDGHVIAFSYQNGRLEQIDHFNAKRKNQAPSKAIAHGEAIAPGEPVAPPKHILRVYIMRHGARADDPEESPEVQAKVDRKEDTPLSPAGIDGTLERCKKIFPTYPLPQKIIVSPLLRCAQTAVLARQIFLEMFASKFKKFLDIRMQYDNGIMEVYHPKVLKIPVHTYIPRTPKEMEVMYPIANQFHFDFTPSTIGKPAAEETRGIGGTADARFRDAFNRIAEAACKDGLSCIMLVTHGDALGSAVAMMAPGKSIFEVQYNGLIIADYACNTNAWKMLNGDDFPPNITGVGIMDD